MLEPYINHLATNGELLLQIRARPNARVTKVTGVLDDNSLKVDVHAAPEDGAANEELIRFLADAFDVSVSSITLVAGHRGRIKTVSLVRS